MRVPVLNPAPLVAIAQPRVQSAAQPADAFGAGLGRGIESAAQTAFGIWRQEATRVNEARVMEADTADASHDLETWTSLRQVRGKDAATAFNDAVVARQKRQAEIEATLSNPVQREAFRRASVNRLQSFENRGSAHVVEETGRYEQEVADASLETGMQQIEASRDNWHEAAGTMEATIATRRQFLAKRGVAPEEIDRQTAVIRSQSVRRVIDGLVSDENDLAAKRLFDEHGSALTTEDRIAVVQKLKISSTKGGAMRLADEAFAQHMDPIAGRAWIIKQAGDNPDLRDMAVNRWEGHREAAQRATTEYQVDAYAKAFAILEDPSKDYTSIPAELLQRLEQRPDLKNQLMGFGRKQDRAVTESDPELIVELERLAIDNPVRFAQVDVRALRGRLTPSRLDEYAKAIGQAKAGGKGGKELRGIITREQAVKDSYLAAGIDETKNPEDAAFFRQMLHERVLALEQTTGKEATSIQVGAEARKLQVRVALDPRNGKRPDTVEWQRAKTLIGTLSEDDRTALMAEAGGSIDRAVRMLLERQRKDEADRSTAGLAPSGSAKAAAAGYYNAMGNYYGGR